MIKLLGILVFGLIGTGMLALGISKGDQSLLVMGCVVLAVIALGVAAVRLFPKFFNSEENARVGMKVISKAARGSVRDADR